LNLILTVENRVVPSYRDRYSLDARLNMKIKSTIAILIAFFFVVTILPSFGSAGSSGLIKLVTAINTGSSFNDYSVLDGANHYMYVADWQGSTAAVSVISTITNKVIKTIDLPYHYNGGAGAFYSMRYVPNSNEIWVGGPSQHSYDMNIYILKGTSLFTTIHTTIVSPDNFMRYDPSNGYVYQTWFGGVTIFNGKTNALVKTIPLAGQSMDMVWNPINGQMYIGNYCGFCKQNDFVVAIKGSSISATIKLPYKGQLWGPLAYDPANKGIYVGGGNAKGAFVTIINATNNIVTRTIQFNSGSMFPSSILFNPANNQMYVGDPSNVSLAAINSFTNKVSYLVLPENNCSVSYLVYDSTNKDVYVIVTTASFNTELAVISSTIPSKIVAWLTFGDNYSPPLGSWAVFNTYNSYVYILSTSSVLAVSSS
jgi:DNA-binding beta-propeller fold protein YncE